MFKIINTAGLFVFLTLIGVFSACKDTNSKSTSPAAQQDTLAIATPKVEPTPTPLTLYAWVDQLRVRAAADKKSPIVEEVAEGVALQFLAEKSDFTEKITLRGTQFDEPWLKVKTAKGNIGWVYGGGVKFYAPTIDLAPSPYDACQALFANGKWEKAQACTEKEQARQLKKEARWVSIDDSSTRILLLDGSTKVLPRQEIDEEDQFTTEYRYYLPQMGVHVVKVYGYEWSGFALVNDKSGKEIELTGYPKASADFKHLVTTNLDLMAGFEFNGVQLFGFTDNGLELLFSDEMGDYGPMMPIWLDDRTVEMVFIPSEVHPDQKNKLMRLVQNEAGQWGWEE